MNKLALPGTRNPINFIFLQSEYNFVKGEALESLFKADNASVC